MGLAMYNTVQVRLLLCVVDAAGRTADPRRLETSPFVTLPTVPSRSRLRRSFPLYVV